MLQCPKWYDDSKTNTYSICFLPLPLLQACLWAPRHTRLIMGLPGITWRQDKAKTSILHLRTYTGSFRAHFITYVWLMSHCFSKYCKKALKSTKTVNQQHPRKRMLRTQSSQHKWTIETCTRVVVCSQCAQVNNNKNGQRKAKGTYKHIVPKVVQNTNTPGENAATIFTSIQCCSVTTLQN